MEERKNRRRAIGWVSWLKHFVQAGTFGDGAASDDEQNRKGRVNLFPFYFFFFPPEDS